ncbi:EAL domain-containing protein [Planomicrobium sp. CPCC 101079]|uniref:EAL domain-containing protein n=1 Tax=Planomicrobium sp. CPCC 101079 TaxID=2599618 RepID=UPI0016496F69|nr:EAL domain-containing protein [Planomicrobium sp. CPCC 101079]
MEIKEKQVHELIETRDDFVVLLNTEGVIVHSNQNWMNYCRKHQLPSALWKVGGNYLNCLKAMRKFNELQCIDEVLNGRTKQEVHLSLFYNKEATDYMSVKYRQFPLNTDTKGIILYKYLLTNLPLANSLNTETVLESMTDAFYLLDNQMRFYFLNSESEKILQRKKEDLIGRNIWACFPKTIGTEFYSNYNRAMQERVPLQFEEYYAPLNSWFSVKVYPVADSGLAVYYQKIRKEDEVKATLSEIPTNDFLTGWNTRKTFIEKAEQFLQEEIPFSLLYMNLDNFKYINTLYNHQTGDEVIKNIAKNVDKLLHSQDVAGRLDGDELILLHVHQGEEQSENFREKIREIFTTPIVLKNSDPVTVTASIGVSSYPHDSYSVEELITFAEAAMRTAKKQTGSSFSFFDSGMGTALTRRLVIEKSLTENLQELGFHFALQPQINCETGDLTGIEVLARWNHPTLGPISPVEFINIAEETGTISHLTNCLLEEVFSFINKKEQRFEKFPKTAINVTSSLLTSRKFFEELFLKMEKYQIAPEQIELELTESVELTSSEITLANLMVCRSKGISIAMDDFGTGFSMLSYLVNYPIDKIKLDKSFIGKIGHDAKSEAVLKSLIQFVKGIDCELLAEGVETEEESLFLQENGCPIHQGYLHDKPLSPEEFELKYLKGCHYQQREWNSYQENTHSV